MLAASPATLTVHPLPAACRPHRLCWNSLLLGRGSVYAHYHGVVTLIWLQCDLLLGLEHLLLQLLHLHTTVPSSHARSMTWTPFRLCWLRTTAGTAFYTILCLWCCQEMPGMLMHDKNMVPAVGLQGAVISPRGRRLPLVALWSQCTML